MTIGKEYRYKSKVLCYDNKTYRYKRKSKEMNVIYLGREGNNEVFKTPYDSELSIDVNDVASKIFEL